MSSSIFIGRKPEIERLKALYNKEMPALCVVKGRRRIGKSRLIGEFANISNAQTFWGFAGLAPEDRISAQEQRDNFARQLALMLKIPPMTFLDWSDAFEHLSLHIKPGDIVLREETERMEIVKAGIGTLVGSNKDRIITEVHKVLRESKHRMDMRNIYGIPGVSQKVLEKIKEFPPKCH